MSLITRFCNLFRSRRVSEDAAEELQFHLDSRVRENIGFDMKREDAEADACRRFGNRTLMLESTRDADILVPLQSMLQDFRFAARLMRRRPAFSLMAVILVALGIGVSTSMFSILVRAVFPRSGFENSARLVFLWRFDKRQGRYLEGFSDRLAYSDLIAVRQESRRLTDVSVYRFADFNVNVTGHPDFVPGFEVEPNWLQALGVHPVIGRNFSPGESNVLLITQELSQRLFNPGTNIVGRRVRVDNRPFTVIGILPAGVAFNGAQIFVPLLPSSDLSAPGGPAYYALGNLQKGFTLQEAQAEVNAIRPSHDDLLIHLATLQEKRAAECGPTCGQQHNGIWLLFAAASLVTLLSCANVGNLLLVHTTARRREFSVRAAIGCSRFRLVGQVFTESAVLFLCGGALAVVVAYGLTTALERFAAAYMDVRSATGSFPLDNRALIFAALATLTAAILFGAVPSLRSTLALRNHGFREAPKIDAIPLLRSGARGVLVTCEFALSVILLVGFGLLLRSFLAVESIPVGINTQRLLTVSANIAKQYDSDSKRISFASRVLEKVRDLSTVSNLALTSSLPLTGADDTYIDVEGVSRAPVEVRFISVSPNFFAAMELPIVVGRPFSEHDSVGSASVVVINQTMAHLLFPNGDAIGHRIQMDENPRVWREIVGIAGDVRQRNLEEDARPVFYRPYTQGLNNDLTFAVRVRSMAEMPQAAHALEDAVTKVDPNVAWEPVKSMRQIVYDSESLSLRRPVIRLLGAFGFLALLLTAAGLFAVLSYSVVSRTREIGIRMAIGARQMQILGQILGETLAFISAGALVGSLSAYILSKLLPSGHIGWSGSGIFLYGISRLDSLTYGIVLALLCVICLVAAFLPAKRAMGIDPNAALREE